MGSPKSCGDGGEEGEDPREEIWENHLFYGVIIQKQILIYSLIVQFSKHSLMPTACKTLGTGPALTELHSKGGKETNMAVLYGRVEDVLGDTH